MKLSGKHIPAALELVAVLLVTVLVFRLGVAAAKAEWGYDRCGGEFLLLMLPAFYYLVKRVMQDWIADIREVRRGGNPWRKED